MQLDQLNLNPKAARLNVEYAKARETVDAQEGLSRMKRRMARMLAIDVLHGELIHRNGHTIVVFPDSTEARF